MTRLVCAAAVLAVLNGCAASVVPTSGPSKSAVLDMGTTVDAPYLLTPISDFSVEALQKFPGPSLYGKFGDYRGPVVQTVGVGDMVEVTVFEAAGGGLFSQPVTTSNSTGAHSADIPPQVVQRDGGITVPYAGRIDVLGKTTPEIEKDIVDKLTGKAIEPQAIVNLVKNLSTSVTVTGEVVKGERVPLSARGERLLDVVAETGGLQAPAAEVFVELSRGGKTARVPFQTLLTTPREDIYARPGDTLTLVRHPLSFTAIGAVGNSSVVPFNALGISLEEAVGKAAGLVDDRADPEGVFVFRYEPVAVVRSFPGLTPAQSALNLVPVVYYLNMRDANSMFLARRFAMHDKDIVYVSNSPFSDTQKLLEIVGSISAPIVQAAYIGATLK